MHLPLLSATLLLLVHGIAPAATAKGEARAAVKASRAAKAQEPPRRHALLSDLDAAAHARAADSLRRGGLRPLSLDAYGDPAAPRFVSAWAADSGPAWRLVHGLPEIAFADSLPAWSRAGWIPARVTGAGREPLLAAVLEKDTASQWTRLGLDRDHLRAVCDSAQKEGLRPHWVDAYGTPERPLFAGVWRRNAEGTPWNYSLGDNAASLQEKAATFAEVWVRPALVVPVPGGSLFTVWQESSVGPWELRPDVRGGDALRALAEDGGGLRPLMVSGPAPGRAVAAAGNLFGGPEAPFTALVAARTAPAAKTWTVTGPGSRELAAFDEYMRALMRKHHVRSGALAMVKDGRLVFAHGYTWAEDGYPVTQPNSLFRVASCSKPLTSIAFHKLLREGGRAEGPSLKEKVIALLSLPAGGTPMDARFADITVDDLLSHSAGWIRSKENPDPVFNDYPPGHAIRRRLPAAAKDFLAYMLGQPLQFAPGSQSSYANFGYFLIGRIMENLPNGRGHSYGQTMEEALFRPLGLTRPRLGEGSLVKDRLPGEVMYHARYPYLQRGRDPDGPAWVPGGYGDFDLRNMDAAGAWILAATDYAKVLASFDLGDANPVLGPEAVRTMWAPHRDPRFLRGWFATKVRIKGDTASAKWHNGLFPGTSTLVFYRPDRWSFALFLNRDISPQLTGDVHGRELGRLADRVEAWPDKDLFPEMGIAPFEGRADYTTSAR